MDFDARAFRDALGSFPTGVAVITAGAPSDAAHPKRRMDDAIGITVNSFTSVSLDPPLVLWCMDARSQRHDIFVQAPCFTVSILGTGHREVSSRLAKPGEHRLDGFALAPTELGPPALADCLAVFECAREATLPGGDHTILLGRVLRFSQPGQGAPLVFYRGKYSALDQKS
jgi:flavin reductase (DIM6/NTAB) family NADH-FMN oxidoreductase RutF